MKASFTGGDDLVAVLGRLKASVRDEALRDALTAGGEVIARRARLLAPVLTGRLRDSITVSSTVKADPSVTLAAGDASVSVGPTVYWGRLVEFGTRKMAPHPYMRPAFDEGKDEAMAAIASRLSQAIDQAVA